jgi:zinc protease
MPYAAVQLSEPRSTSFAATVQTIRTDSGIEAWLMEDHSIPLLSMSFAFKGGAAQDRAGKPGASAMLAGLLDKGAGVLDAAAFQQALDDDAVQLDFGVDRGSLHGQLRTPSSARRRALDLLAMSLGSPRFDPDALERQRDRTVAALKRQSSNAAAIAGRAFRIACHGDHPYGRSVSGELDTLPTITRDDLVVMRRRMTARDNLKVACVGAIGAAELRDELDRVFGGLPATAQLADVPPASVGGVGIRRVIELDVPQSVIRFGRPGIKRNDPDHDAAVVVNHCLGAGTFTSRLYREVREKRGLCYSIQTRCRSLDQAAVLVGSTATSNERAGEALDVIGQELQRMAADGIPADELEKAKRNLAASFCLQFDTSRKIASLLCQLQLVGAGIARLDNYPRSIAAVSVDDAARTAARLIGDGKMLVAIAGKPAGL